MVVGDGPLRSLFPQAVGFVPPRELGPYYERASVVVVPSRREGYGMVAREAMAYGRPVVATEVGGLVDAVEDGVTGLLVAPGNVAGLRDATERLLGDAGLRARLGSCGPRRADGVTSPVATAEARASRLRGRRQSARQRTSVRSTRRPSSAVSFLPSSRERAAYEIGTS